MTKSEAVRRYRYWVSRHARALNLLGIGVWSVALLSTTAALVQVKPFAYTSKDPFAEGGLWGCFFILSVMGLTLSLGLRRRITKPTPMPIDPGNPPATGVFSRDSEDPEVRCFCHDLPLTNGQEVVSWPQPPKYTCADKANR